MGAWGNWSVKCVTYLCVISELKLWKFTPTPLLSSQSLCLSIDTILTFSFNGTVTVFEKAEWGLHIS
jgi:hypothetical protein